MNKVERIRAVLAGCRPDRAPYSFWHHFRPKESLGQAAVQAHIRHLEEFDLDFLKVMNDHLYPWQLDGVIDSAAGLKSLKKYSGDEGPFSGQLEVLKSLREEVKDDILLTSTIFGPWTVLRLLTGPPVKKHGPPKMTFADDPRQQVLDKLVRENRKLVGETLLRIAATLADFAKCCIEAGADGIFLSVRDDWVDTPANGAQTYDELVQEADLTVLRAAARGSFNVLHVCGKPLGFKRFAGYPVHAINWADRYAGPAISQVSAWLKPAIMAGVDNLNTLVNGTPGECLAEVRDALAQAGARPLIIAPGCTYDADLVPEENLRAICKALAV